MNCERAAQAAIKGQNSEKADAAEIDFLSSHLRECPSCASRYAALLPFLRRDSGGAFFSAPGEAGAGTVDAIMSRIPKTPPSAVRPFPRAIALTALAAAAALIIIFAALPALRGSQTVNVRFSLNAPQASSVRLAADFTSWSTEGYSLEKSARDGSWEIIVKLKKGKSYRYNFIIDGKFWIADPSSDLILDDGFGNRSSSITI